MVIRIIICLMIGLSYNNLLTYSESQNGTYPQLCLLAAQNDTIFNTFRRHPAYRAIVETLWYEAGKLFLQEINTKYPHLLPYFKKICAEDVVGSPQSYLYPQIGIISPNVLRYIKIVGDLIEEFGSLTQFNILEIGGGYGGQCKAINDICGFKNYTIIDLQEVTPLISRYLSHFSIQNITTINSNDNFIQKQYDLVISNYAFSEINRKEQQLYIEAFIKQVPYGYMVYNHFHHINPLSLNEFVELLRKQNKQVRVIQEDPSRMGDIIIWHPTLNPTAAPVMHSY